ncbi:putative cysteine desulfurase [Thalassoglobus neptunius]|uniref:Cysteine desulfurase n=1 Tax=Thalassoglobus neptunius TaxID=1938619 RepID=A0A5C5WGF2_9PLAN|nr:SufS family cysteine desulfurase [Thalassoglobus neptunius]TWT49858.1 putative cysteine desulfurase [Thalassoglobus neptunius]
MATQQVALCGVRDQFPVFGQTLPNGQPVTFLDTAASAQKPNCVIEAEERVQRSHYANAYRGVYEFGAQIDEELEATREAIEKLIGAEDVSEIAFTAGSTMSINMVAFGWGGRHLQEGDEIVLNEMEHHANLVPWQQVAERTGAKIVYIPLTEDGQLDLLAFDELVNSRTRVLSVTGMSNMLGTINPIRRLADRVHEAGGIVVVDGAQSVPHAPVDVQADGIDFLVFSGHKLYGPTGVGVLYGRKDLLEETDPLLFGGHMIDQVTKSGSTWASAPAKFEAGTLPIVQAIALKSAIDFVNELGFEAIHEQESLLTRYAMEALSQVPGLKIYGPRLEDRGAIVSFTIDGAHPEDLAQLLNRKGVFVRHGHHCTMPLHDLLNVSSTVRASFGVYNTTEDVDQLIAAIEFARQRLRLA